jgi:hypothetical protein
MEGKNEDHNQRGFGELMAQAPPIKCHCGGCSRCTNRLRMRAVRERARRRKVVKPIVWTRVRLSLRPEDVFGQRGEAGKDVGIAV